MCSLGHFFFQFLISQAERLRIVASGTSALDDPNFRYNQADVDALHVERDERKKRSHKREHGKVSFADMARLIGARWKKLSKNQRALFEERASREKEYHSKKIQAYKSLKAREKKADENQSSVFPNQQVSSSNMERLESFSRSAGVLGRMLGEPPHLFNAMRTANASTSRVPSDTHLSTPTASVSSQEFFTAFFQPQYMNVTGQEQAGSGELNAEMANKRQMQESNLQDLSTTQALLEQQMMKIQQNIHALQSQPQREHHPSVQAAGVTFLESEDDPLDSWAGYTMDWFWVTMNSSQITFY